MKQLSQKLKDGQMLVTKMPVPSLNQGHLLIKNHYSLISAGTEGSTVKAARKGYIGKAKARPQQVKQVIDTVKAKGITQTYRAVMKKLDAFSPLGYSCVGEVVDLAPNVQSFSIGDFVACGGLTACHAEIVSVPWNLCVKINADTDLKQAAYNTLGAIAIQGVRQADLRLGENCAVIGLGLIGQLTALLLRASGVRVIGVDVNKAMVDVATEHCLDLGLSRDGGGIEDKIFNFTNGIGCDAVIITAASDSLDPINFAGAISRKRGSVVVVGAVPTGFDREPHFYKKELTIKMSCSYGPGRYDPNYEEKGMDYPVGYVRWTEKRNMQAFQDLIATKRVDVSYLTTHTFKLENVPTAYDMIIDKSEPFIGILIEYDAEKKIERTKIFANPRPTTRDPRPLVIGFIGAGSYAQSYILPNIPKKRGIALKGVMTSSSTGSRSVADRFGFEFCTGNADDIVHDEEINTVFIVSRHDSHGRYVIECLKAGKNVFVEKPLCFTFEELEEIKAQCLKHDSRILMIGYNRRFSLLTDILRQKISPGPVSMTYRINAGAIPGDSWIQDPQFGGGRILGELCHFVDYLTFINGSLPVSVYATSMNDPENLNDTLTIALKYRNGSIGSIQYFANGSKAFDKEHIEIYGHGTTAILKDFRELLIYGSGKPYRKKLISQDKGQKNEIELFVRTIEEGLPPSIPLEEILNATDVTFKVIESIRTGDVLSF